MNNKLFVIRCILMISYFFLISHFFPLCATAKTFLANSQVPFSSVSPELISGFRNDRVYAAFSFKDYALQVVPFGGTSTHHTQNNLCAYFFPHNQKSLLVAEDGPANNFNKTKNLLAQNFNIFTKTGNFSSEITIAPRQTVVGFGVHLRQSILRDLLQGRGLWWSVSTPIMQVRNAMHLQEFIINDGGGIDPAAGVVAVGSMKQAFMQSAWLYGKISDRVLTKAGLGDIEFKIGYDQYIKTDPCSIEFYTGLIIPTGNKGDTEFLFAPIVGRGHHAGLMLGGAFGTDVFSTKYDGQVRVRWEVALHNEYLFPNTQNRSLDLVDKPWGRYMPVYGSLEQAQAAAALQTSDPARARNSATPGINVFTQKVKVSPKFSADINSAFVIEYNSLRAEVGYNMFVKNKEKVRLSCEWQPVVALKYFEGIGQTNPIRDITGNKYLEQQVNNDSGQKLVPVELANFESSLIQYKDLNINAAQTPRILSHTLYASVGTNFPDHNPLPGMHGGLSYTFSQSKSVVQRCLLWVKGTVSF